MSSDLFAAFGDTPGQPKTSQTAGDSPSTASGQRFSFFDDFNTQSTPATVAPSQQNIQWKPESNFQTTVTSHAVEEEEEDDFGDFEDATTTKTEHKGSSFDVVLGDIHQAVHKPQYQAAAPTATSSAQKQYSSNLLDLDDAFGSVSFQSPGPPRPQQVTQAQQLPSSRLPSTAEQKQRSAAIRQQRDQTKLDRIAPDPDVLFDAGTWGDENDDFGDFEGDENPTTPRSPPPPSRSQIGPAENTGLRLLELSEMLEPLQELAPKPKNLDIATFNERKSKISTSKPTATGDDNWGEFADWDSSEPAPAPSAPPAEPAAAVILSALQQPAVPDPSNSDLPPTNVPPPAVILSLFPPIFSEAQTNLFKPLAAQTYQLKNRVLSDPATINFLRAYVLLATVAARVIAGRKLRWKRDKHLAQGMRIGPASSRATSGMKLTGIDRGEDLREDREVLDVVRAWKEQLGRLRSTIAGVKSVAGAGLAAAFELQETMPVRTAKESEGGIRAPQPCALCGLKREERLSKVDIDVQDSFGEWWIEQMSMHRGNVY